MAFGTRQATDREGSHYDALMRASQEISLHAVELAVALRADELVLRRHVFRSQWRARVGGAVLLAAIATFSAGIAPFTDVAIAAVLVAYLGVVWMFGRRLQSDDISDAALRSTFLGIFLADVFASTVIMFLGGPETAGRILIIGGILTSMAAFYSGQRDGNAVAIAVAVSYVVAVLVARLALSAIRPTWSGFAINLVLFGGVAFIVNSIFGSFRRRLDALRMYCKLGELGEPAGAIPIDTRRVPDDLTFLAESFDAMRSRLADQIGSDPLTGCANRRTLEKRLLADWRHAKRRGTAVAVAAIDIDHFKQINDTRGHPVGDLVLQQIASIMLSTARDTDTVARLGGDEFVIVLPDTDFNGAYTFAERLRQGVMDFTFGPPGSPLGITISVGVAIGNGDAAIEPEQLMADADRSLYQAKTDGRNRVCA